MPVLYSLRTAQLSDYEAVRALEQLEFLSHREARPDYFKPVEESAVCKSRKLALVENIVTLPDFRGRELALHCWQRPENRLWRRGPRHCIFVYGTLIGPRWSCISVRGMHIQYYRLEERL